MTREEAMQQLYNVTFNCKTNGKQVLLLNNAKLIVDDLIYNSFEAKEAKYIDLLTKFTKLKDLDLIVGGKELQDEAKKILGENNERD